MKSLVSKKSSWLMAAVMMGAVGLTGCSNESVVEEQAPVNPTYNGESVKTQFAINIPYANPSKRMTGDNTQQSGETFLGMSNIRLIPYVDASPWDGTISKILALGDIASDNGVSNSSGAGTHETQKTYNDVEIPVGTSNFLFYAEGTQATGSDAEKKVNYGSLTANVDGAATKADINFTLEDIFSGNNFGDTQAALIALLNAVEDAQITNGGTGSQTITWASYGSQDSPTGNALTLQNLYKSYTKMKAGSANSILMLMQALYTEVDKFDDAATDEGKVATAIMQAITKSDGYVVNSSTVKIENTSGTLVMTGSSADVLNFPTNLGLPDGAVRVKFESNAFASDNFTLEVGGSAGLKIDDITYPASLYYFVDSDLGASSNATATFPTNGSWGAETDWTNFPDATVNATTRVIAMKEPVQYGVGLLATTVKCSAASLLDNGGNSINIETGFTFNGVLIGGQPDDVKWNMLQAKDDETNRTKTIYDAAVVAGTTVTTTAMSTPNYTLALDNSKFTGTDQGTRADANNQDKVNIAIELVNNTGNNFEGADGMIYNGATFYMVAQLDPSDASLNNTTDKKSVFMQDYKTTANLTIKSLKGAYNVIPDLRSTNLTFGLAVDLDWQTGLTFTVDIE